MSTINSVVDEQNKCRLSRTFMARSLGVIGMGFPIYGNLIPPSALRAECFVIGAILMLLAAVIERELFFSVLQLVVLAGAAMYFTSFSLVARAAVPIVLAGSFLLYFAYSGRLQDKLTLFGSIGIAILAIGYAVSSPFVYFAGGVILTIYATMSYRRGVSIAILWAILNFIFSIAAAINIYHYILR